MPPVNPHCVPHFTEERIGLSDAQAVELPDVPALLSLDCGKSGL